MDLLNEKIGAREDVGLGSGVHDPIMWRSHWKLEKRPGDGSSYRGGIEAFKREIEPYEVFEFDGNLLTNAGGAALWDLVTGGGISTAFDAGNAFLGVGDSNTFATTAQTDLQAGGNKIRKGMNATYPQYSNRVVTFQSDFVSGEAEWTWNEVGTFNAAAAADMLNRKVQALGVKGAGSTWTLTETLTIS